MNLFTRYLAYLRDNPEGYWFKRKLYGWGWTPATWHHREYSQISNSLCS